MTSWGETQLMVARDFQQCAVPLYRRPYPPRRGAFYGYRGDVRLTYDEYAAAVASGAMVPRAIHGCMHAARVTLYAALLAQLHRRAGRIAGDLHALQMAAAFHDAAREDEGRDRWDGASGALFGAWILERGGSQADAAAWSDWLASKDAPRARSLEHGILHDADALDLQRVVRDRFRPDRLWLFRTYAGTPDRDKTALVRETRTLIDITEPDAIKLELEEAPDYYVKVLHIVTAVHRGTGALPLLDVLLAEVLAG
jgi:hypothetical protein